MLNGDYLMRVLRERMKALSKFDRERDDEIRVWGREQVVTGQILPYVPEIAGLYLQSLEPVQQTGIDVDKWIGYLDDNFSNVIDTLFQQWNTQFDIAFGRVDRHVREYHEMLPKGELALSPEGYPLEFMANERILWWVDHLDSLNRDYLMAYTNVLDTVTAYDRPVGFGDAIIEKPLQHVLDTWDRYAHFIADAKQKQVDYAKEYEDNPMWYDEEFDMEVDAVWWLNAVDDYESIRYQFLEYGLGLLKRGLDIKDEYVIFRFASLTSETLVFRRQEIESATEEILSDNGIRHQCSKNLRDIWK